MRYNEIIKKQTEYRQSLAQMQAEINTLQEQLTEAEAERERTIDAKDFDRFNTLSDEITNLQRRIEFKRRVLEDAETAAPITAAEVCEAWEKELEQMRQEISRAHEKTTKQIASAARAFNEYKEAITAAESRRREYEKLLMPTKEGTGDALAGIGYEQKAYFNGIIDLNTWRE